MESGTDVPLGIRDLKLPYSTKIADMLLVVYFREILGEIMSLFTPQGASNAMSIKDAMNTLVRYASILEEGQPSNSALVGCERGGEAGITCAGVWLCAGIL